MWSFKFTGTPDKVATAVAANPAPSNPTDALQHAKFQAVIAAYLATLPLPPNHNAISINIVGSVDENQTRLQLTMFTLRLEV